MFECTNEEGKRITTFKVDIVLLGQCINVAVQ